MKIIKIILILLTINLSSAKDFKGLSDSEIEKLTQGETILFQEEVKDRPWPKVTLFTSIEKTPKEATASQ